MDDFNVDTGEWFPDQRFDGDPTECVGITVADICGDIDAINYDPDFSYAMALRLMGSQPTTGGSDPYAGLLGAVAYGLLPMSDADFAALTHGQLYVANWQNYAADDRQEALAHVQRVVRRVSLDFDTVISEATVSRGVALCMTWYASFMYPNTDGVIYVASTSPLTLHEVRVVGQKTVAGQRYMVIKPWLGKTYGSGGYCLLSEAQFRQCAISAFRFDPAGNRFLTLIGIATTRFPYLLEAVPALLQTGAETIQGLLNGSPNSSPPNVPQEPPPIAPVAPQEPPRATMAPRYDWSTQLAAKHSVRLICDEEGLSLALKNDLTACVHQESGFLNVRADGSPVKHENWGMMGGMKVLSSTDWGIAQVNDYWHIGKGKDFESVAFVTANPEACVRWMARLFKAGKQSLWSSYTSGAYRQWLPKAADPTVV